MEISYPSIFIDLPEMFLRAVFRVIVRGGGGGGGGLVRRPEGK